MGIPVNAIGNGPGKNYIINGGMVIQQRGSVAMTNNTFQYGGSDRFAVGAFFAGGSSGGTIARQGFGAPVLTGHMQAAVNLSNTGAGNVLFYHRIESQHARRLNGKTVTVSFLAFHAAGISLNLAVNISRPTTTADTWGAITILNNAPTLAVPTNTMTRYTYTFSIGATDAEKGLEVRPFFAVPSTLASKSYYIGEMQLEEGSTATSLELIPPSEEMLRCQRYYAIVNYGGLGSAEGTTLIGFNFKFPVEIRTPGTLTRVATATFRHQSGDVNSTGSLANQTYTTLGGWTQLTGFGGLTNGALIYDRGTSSWLAHDCEL